MSIDLAYNWLLIAIMIGIEYWMKQLFEDIYLSFKSKPLFTYVLYRLFNFMAIILILNIFFEVDCSWFKMSIISLLAVMIGSSELFFCYINELLYQKFKYRKTILYFIPLIGLFLYSLYISASISLRIDDLPHLIYHYFSTHLFIFSDIEKSNLSIILASFILLSHVSNYIIRWILVNTKNIIFPDAFFCNENSELGNYQSVKMGQIIGILERWLFLVLIIIGQYAAIGFILAAKSVARFKDNGNDTKFSEYSFVGTLISVSITLVFGLIIKNIGGN